MSLRVFTFYFKCVNSVAWIKGRAEYDVLKLFQGIDLWNIIDASYLMRLWNEESFFLKVVFDVVVKGGAYAVANDTSYEGVFALGEGHEIKVWENSQNTRDEA